MGTELPDRDGITVVSPSGGELTYEADDCVQFGTLAIALCENGLPQWDARAHRTIAW